MIVYVFVAASPGRWFKDIDFPTLAMAETFWRQYGGAIWAEEQGVGGHKTWFIKWKPSL